MTTAPYVFDNSSSGGRGKTIAVTNVQLADNSEWNDAGSFTVSGVPVFPFIEISAEISEGDASGSWLGEGRWVANGIVISPAFILGAGETGGVPTWDLYNLAFRGNGVASGGVTYTLQVRKTGGDAGARILFARIDGFYTSFASG